jgi:hypothetical protein
VPHQRTGLTAFSAEAQPDEITYHHNVRGEVSSKIQPKFSTFHLLDYSPNITTMATTFNVYYSSRAMRLTQDLNQQLLASYSSAERQNIRIVTIFLHDSHGCWLQHPNGNHYRYIRIVIDTPRGRLRTREQKQELLQKTMKACFEYEGKHAGECEVEVRINEFDEEDVMRVVPR